MRHLIYASWIPAAAMTLLHFAISAAMTAANSSGVLPTGSAYVASAAPIAFDHRHVAKKKHQRPACRFIKICLTTRNGRPANNCSDVVCGSGHSTRQTVPARRAPLSARRCTSSSGCGLGLPFYRRKHFRHTEFPQYGDFKNADTLLVSRRGQITLPAAVRKRLGIRPRGGVIAEERGLTGMNLLRG